MALIGGYHIVNLKLVPLSIELPKFENGKNKQGNIDTGIFYEDIYYNLINSHAKRVVLSGLNFNGTKFADYEVLFYSTSVDGVSCYQCILRKEWNTSDKFVITYYLNIYEDNHIGLSYDMTCYETDPDKAFSKTSTNALQNKVITEKFKVVDDTLTNHDTRITANRTDIDNHYTEFNQFKTKTEDEQQVQDADIDNLEAKVETLEDQMETLYPVETSFNDTSAKPMATSVLTERFSDVDTKYSSLAASYVNKAPIGVVIINNAGDPIASNDTSTISSYGNFMRIRNTFSYTSLYGDQPRSEFNTGSYTIDLSTMIEWAKAQGLDTLQLEKISGFTRVSGTVSFCYNDYYTVDTYEINGLISEGKIDVYTLPYEIAVHDTTFTISNLGSHGLLLQFNLFFA